MPNPDDDVAGYAATADTYWQAGWRGVLPIRHKCKSHPPKGHTGKTGVDPSYADILQWSELYPNGNLCLRMPPDIIGIDVDAYGAKTGALTITEAEKRWGPLPPTVRSTSREDGISGIRLYRIPPGTELVEGIEFAELGFGDIEICQRRHRYVLAWPSIHPEGRGYWWRNHHDQLVGIPTPDELPELPTTWVTNLTHQRDKSTAPNLNGNSKPFPIRQALTSGEPSTKVVNRLRQAIKELNLPGHSRHDTARGHVMALLRLGKTGEPGVEHALIALGEMFIALITPDRPGGKDEATHEYKAMVTGDGAARHLAQPSITDWVHAIVTDEPAPQQPEPAKPEPAPATTYSHLADIERGFWETRDSLQAIWTTAMARMCSPWAVLAHCAARALTLVPHHTVLPPVIGGIGSLNWFAAIVAKSGGGKGASAATARLLIPAHITTRPVGSGEGIVKAFRGTSKGDEPLACEAIMITIDEVDALTVIGARQGSTTLTVLRQGFSGEILGFSYADPSKNNQVPEHSYRMTAVVSVQPERAGALFADSGGGTPQRFMWFPGTDSRITANTPWPAGPLPLPKTTDWLYPRELQIPAEAEQFIKNQHVLRQQGDSEAMDGHAIFCREKFAFALTLLDNRTDMTVDDWELSGIAADVSTYTRELTADVLRDETARMAQERGAVRGIEMESASIERDYKQVERQEHVLRWLLAKLDDEPKTHRQLARAIYKRNGPLLDGAILKVIDEGLAEWVQMDGKQMLARKQ